MINLVKIFSAIDSGIKNDLKIPQQTIVIENNVAKIIEVTTMVFGAVAMLVIIFAGIQYLLSQGDPAKTTTARNTVIYAAVGLAISILAFSIVSFVSGKF